MTEKRLAYINSDGFRFNIGFPNYPLQFFEGFGDIFAENQSKKAPFRIGSSYVGTRIDKRYCNIGFCILGNNEAQVEDRRKIVINTFSPELDIGYLEVTQANGEKYCIDCKASELSFPSGDAQGPTWQEVILQLEAFNPYWYKPRMVELPFTGYSGGLVLPLKLPWAFGVKGTRTTVRNNSTSINTPIELFMYGEVTEPRIENITTGQYIEVITTIGPDEILYIDTGVVKKTVEINGENAFHYVNPEGHFWSLIRGDNEIRYSSFSEAPGSKCILKYREILIGV